MVVSTSQRSFVDFCVDKGIKWEFTAPYTPTQNGVVEHMNRTIQGRLMSMLSQSHLPQSFWAEALMIAVYLINRTPNASLQFKVPEELWLGHPVSYQRLRTFGCEAYAHVPKELRAKLDPKSRKCISCWLWNGWTVWLSSLGPRESKSDPQQ